MGKRKKGIPKKIASKVEKHLQNDPRTLNWIIDQNSIDGKDVPELNEKEFRSPIEQPIQEGDNHEIRLRDAMKCTTLENRKNLILHGCEWEKCSYETDLLLEYFKHVNNHSNDINYEDEDNILFCEWDLCTYNTKIAEELESHLNFHAYHTHLKTLGESFLNCLPSLPKCNYDSRQRNNISNYKTFFECEWQNCDKNFDKVYEFILHVKYHYEDLFPKYSKSSKEFVQCRWGNCKQQYKHLSRLLEHSQTHSKEKRIGCFTCGALFTGDLKLKDHFLRQMDDEKRAFECEKCFKKMPTSTLLKEHEKSHVLKHFCDICGKGCVSASHLTIHIQHKHVSVKPCKCTQCDYHAVTQKSLLEHMRTHKASEVYTCTEFGCGKVYKSFLAFKRHILGVHEGKETWYVCHLCNKKYTVGGTLSEHLIKKHGFERAPGVSRFSYKMDDDGFMKYSANYGEGIIKCPTRSTISEKPLKISKLSVEPNYENLVKIQLCNADEERRETRSSTNKYSYENDNNKSLKRIDDFTVMKKYLNKGKDSIILTVDDMDKTGTILQRKIYQADELCLAEN